MSSPAQRPRAVPPGTRSRPVTGDRAAAHPVLEDHEVARVLARLTHQLLEREGVTAADGRLVLLGIPTRGVALARRIAALVARFEGLEVPVGALDITLYRDDLALRGVRALAATDLPPAGVDGATVVLVDDVLFSGRTVRAALDALSDLGRPRAVQLAVLVDRGHRELPIRADYVGKNIPTSLQETVHVLLEEYDGRDAVLLGPAALGGGAGPVPVAGGQR
ncbi:MAG TPA: bifunctional pyr operon transcriptional regulator/uracil phosphoribosyltransferase PyrR [Mycobacteriales bacterium]